MVNGLKLLQPFIRTRTKGRNEVSLQMVSVKKDGVRKGEFTGEYFGLVQGRTFLLKSTVVLITEEREDHIE